ncbi:MAG TPA: adenylyl-sulfate kinase [Burkholderiales bacterium]|nr:adenylyl-sulfate kinase [Burkholderiales bacterium]
MSTDVAAGFVIWITGLPNSGKTTVAELLQHEFRSKGVTTVWLDGDHLRRIFSNRWGYSREERVKLAAEYSKLAAHLSMQGLTVIVSVVAMFDSVYRQNRDTIGNYFEVFLDVPYGERVHRDKATAKNVYASSSYSETIYDVPRGADLHLQNFGENSPRSIASKIAGLVIQRIPATPGG